MDAVLVKNADRMMTSARLLEDGIQLTFADGCNGQIPFADSPRSRSVLTCPALSCRTHTR